MTPDRLAHIIRAGLLVLAALVCIWYVALVATAHADTGDRQRAYQAEIAAEAVGVGAVVYFGEDVSVQVAYCREGKHPWRCPILVVAPGYTRCWFQVHAFRHLYTIPDRLNGCRDWLQSRGR